MAIVDRELATDTILDVGGKSSDVLSVLGRPTVSTVDSALKGGDVTGDRGMTSDQLGSAVMGIGSAATSVIGGVFSGILGGINNDTAKIRARAAEDARKFNAEMADNAARQVMRKLEDDEASYMEGVGQLIAQQRSSAAGQGIKVGVGVSAQLEAETRDIAMKDLNAMRSAAAQQALGLRAQAFNQRVAGMVESGNIRNAAQADMLNAQANMMSDLTTGLYGLARAIPASREESK